MNLELLVRSCDPQNSLQLLVKESKDKSCWFVSKTQPDFNLEVRQSKRGFLVEFYCSTYDCISHSAIQYEDVIKGLTLLLAGNESPDNEELRELLNW